MVRRPHGARQDPLERLGGGRRVRQLHGRVAVQQKIRCMHPYHLHRKCRGIRRRSVPAADGVVHAQLVMWFMRKRDSTPMRSALASAPTRTERRIEVIKRTQRIPMRDLATLAAEDRETVEKNAMNGQVFNIFKVLAHHPKLVKRWTPFAGHILSKQSLPFRDRELLILRIGWLNQAEYEFAQHELIARRGGVSEQDIEKIKQGPKGSWNEHEAALMQAADDLYENSVVSDATWATLSKAYSTEQMMDVVFTIGQYNLVSWALNSFGVPLDDFLPKAKA
ncbi:carboxymuconolactone decarboxylase family protein [Vineibacter terrae]|uniref:Carboxymuconolactone decarboxylase family protein n=1 Tax=Vineibacter terrae TaxID=2586908 RepID=A0A5C8PCX1_9HYPH|nr:carboxymuconolactone decarboxylase family protein [Vineibacter terrae]